MSRRGRRGGHGGGSHGGSERWLITYADLITLLAAYFIMVYSLAQIDLAKFDRVMGGYRQSAASFGVMTGGPANLDGGDGVLEGAKGAGETPADRGGGAFGIEEAMAKIQSDIQTMGLGGHVTVRMTEEGLVVSMAGPLLFDSGKADLRPEARPILDSVARVISRLPQALVRVEGHADSIPIQTERFPSNWELSSARAATVVRHLTATGLNATRFTVVGFGDSRPVGVNSAPEGRARNRRVEVIIFKPRPPS